MKRITLNYFVGLTLLLSALFTACNKENDFYFVGRQPVELLFPSTDSVIVLDYTNPENLIKFSWYSKRPYMDVNLKFSLNKEFPVANTVIKSAGLATEYSMAALRMDELLTELGVALGATVPLYWTIEVKKPEFGWCDDKRVVNVTRFTQDGETLRQP